MTTQRFGTTPVYEMPGARALSLGARRGGLASVVVLALMLSALADTARQRPPGREKQKTVDKGGPPRRPHDAVPLVPGKPVERVFGAGKTHTYRITLGAGQYLHVIVEQKGVDVVVAAFGPDGRRLVEVDSPNGPEGPEPVLLVAPDAGDYRLEVSAREGVAEWRYEVKIEELRTATAQDRQRVAAQWTFAEGVKLRLEGTAESSRKALRKFHEALPRFRAAGDRGGEAMALHDIGLVHNELGENELAFENLSRALPIFRDIKDRRGEAATLNDLGLVYKDIEEPQKALQYFNLALPIWRELRDRREEANTLNGIGLVYDDLGENQKAIEIYQQALPILQEAGDPGGAAVALINIGMVYKELGEYQKALNHFYRALPILREVQDLRAEAGTLNSIGLLYASSGEPQKALEHYKQALRLSEVVGNPREKGIGTAAIGQVYRALGENHKALESLHQALKIFSDAQDRRGVAVTLGNLAEVYLDTGNDQKGLECLNQALPIFRELEDRHGLAGVLNDLGVAYEGAGEPQKALESYKQALAFWRESGVPSGLARTLYNLARLELALGDFAKAQEHSEAVLKVVESLRTKLVGEGLRASYFASVQEFYEFRIDLLMRLHRQHPSAGHNVEALRASERARARGLLDLLSEAHVDIRQGGDPALLGRERELQQRLNARGERLTRLRNGEATGGQATAVAKEIEALEKEVEALTTEYQQVQAQIRGESPGYAALTQPQPSSLEEIQQLLDAETLLLEYSLGEERSYLWAVTRASLKSYELPKRAEVETVARRVIAPMSLRGEAPPGEAEYRKWKAHVAEADAAYPKAAAELSHILLGGAAEELSGKRLLIVADGILQYVPFAALPEPGALTARGPDQPLVAGHEIIMLPSASTLSALRRERRERRPYTKTVAVFADPVFDAADPRVGRATAGGKGQRTIASTRGGVRGNSNAAPTTAPASDALRSASEVGLTRGGRLRRLLSSKREAEAILAVTDAGQGTAALGFGATRERVVAGSLSGYRIVHFATHGLLNSRHPELSGVLLSLVDERGRPRDGFLGLHEIYNLSLPVEMVVLSACQTSLGKEVRGEGLVGLTRGFMYAGARRVVASLWSVDDASTAELMGLFYMGMLRGGLSPAAALRAAQNELRGRAGRQSPFHWAGFVLQGEWQNTTQ